MLSFSAVWKDSITCLTDDGGKSCGAIALCSISGLLLLSAHAALGYERCKNPGQSGREATTSLYCFLGNSCSAIGAILSRQLHVQIVFASFSATMDAVSFITLCVPMCFCKNPKAEMRSRLRRRRRQLLYGLCVLLMITGGFLKIDQKKIEIEKLPVQRRLLQLLIEDNADVLGYVLGILSLVIVSTSRFPALYRTCTNLRMKKAQLFSVALCSLAGACYAAALLLYDSRKEFILKTMPWLLSATLCAIMDIFIVFTHLCKRQNPVVSSPDTVGLLENSTDAVKEKPNEEGIHATPQIKKKNAEKLTGNNSYLHVNCPSERKSPTVSDLSRTVKKEKVFAQSGVCGKEEDCVCLSDTSFDSNVLSSDLEWDFEEPIMQLCEAAAVQLKDNRFPSQEWQSIPLTEHCTDDK